MAGRSSIGIHFAAVCLGIAAAIAVAQFVVYLEAGYWPSVTVASLLKLVSVDWASQPDEWPTLHAVIEFVPLSLAFAVVGVLSALYFFER